MSEKKKHGGPGHHAHPQIVITSGVDSKGVEPCANGATVSSVPCTPCPTGHVVVRVRAPIAVAPLAPLHCRVGFHQRAPIVGIQCYVAGVYAWAHWRRS